MVRRDDWVKGAHFRYDSYVRRGSRWPRLEQGLGGAIDPREGSLEYRSECTGVRLFCLVIIYHAPRAQACNLRETPFECFAECLTFASFNLADYRHRYIGAGLRADDAGRRGVGPLPSRRPAVEFNSAINEAREIFIRVLACPWITPYPAAGSPRSRRDLVVLLMSGDPQRS